MLDLHRLKHTILFYWFFIVSNITQLATIRVHDGLEWSEQYQTNYAPFENTESLVLSGFLYSKLFYD